MDSVDLSPKHCDFARKWTRPFGASVEVHCADSVAYLSERPGPIDILYLDSLDTTEPGYAEHGLREIQAANPRLHERTLVAFDDTSLRAGKWIGKGMLGVPWLIERGWKTIHIGHQTVLTRGG